MCTTQMQLIGRLDWFDRIDRKPLQQADSEGLDAAVTRQQLQEEIHFFSHKGSVHRGARAFRQLGFRIPLLLPLGLILSIPGIFYVADPIYTFVAKRRLKFSKLLGCQGSCDISFDKKD